MFRPTLAGLTLISLAGCDFVMDKVGEKVGEKVAEKVIEHSTGSDSVDISEGKVVVKKDGEEVTFQAEGKGDKGKVVIKSDKGNAVFEADGEKGRIVNTGPNGQKVEFGREVPEGFPLKTVDLGEVVNGMKSENDKEVNFSVSYKSTSKDVKALSESFKSQFTDAGFEAKNAVETKVPTMEMVMVVGEKKDGNITATAQILKNVKKDEVAVNLIWKQKKAAPKAATKE